MQRKQNLTIDDIARDLNVSKTTVSRAISGKGRISAATRERVLAYIQQCNYRPSAAAKGLAESRTYNLALVIPRSFIALDQPFVREGMSAICEEAFLQDYNILICLSTDDSPASLLRTLDNRKVDGVILSRTVENDTLVDILTQRGIPFATMGSLPPEKKGCATVETDHNQVGGCRAFTLELLKNHRGKAALLGNDMHYIVNQSRLAGFRQAAEKLGIPEENVYLRANLYDRAACSAAVDELLENGVRYFITMDNDICMQAIDRIKEHGLSIPGDVQVASMYDTAQLTACFPTVSALRFDAAELGRVSCRELLRCLRGEEYDPTPRLGYEICLRESTV